MNLSFSFRMWCALLLCAAVVVSAQIAAWPVARHDLQRTSSATFQGPRGNWLRGESWRSNLNGPVFDLLADANGNAVATMNIPTSTSSSSLSLSSSGGVLLGGSSSGISVGSSMSSSGSGKMDDYRQLQKRSTSLRAKLQHEQRKRDASAARKRAGAGVGGADDDGQEVAWFNPAGNEIWQVPPNSPLSFASTISTSGQLFYAITFDSTNASHVPTLSVALTGNPNSLWVLDLPDLLDGLEAPLTIHLDLFPLGNVILVSAWQWNSSLASFAGVDVQAGVQLWLSSSFFFTPVSDESFNFAVAASEAVAYTTTLGSKGLEVSAWDIDLLSGNFSRLWHTHDDKVTQTGFLGYTVLDETNNIVFASYSSASSTSLLWALNSTSGDALWQLPFQTSIAGIALGPNNSFWLATADGYLSQGYRSSLNLTLNWRQNVCQSNSPMQSPISDMLGAGYLACGNTLMGLLPNGSICFSAYAKNGVWLGPATPVIASPNLLIAVASRYIYGWRDAPPAPPSSKPQRLKLWEVLALSVGSPILFLWLVFAITYLSLRESPEEEQVSLLRPIYSPPRLGFVQLMAVITYIVFFPYGRSAAYRLRNARRFIQDNDYAKARRASRRSLLYSLKGQLIGLPLLVLVLGAVLWILVWQHLVN